MKIIRWQRVTTFHSRLRISSKKVEIAQSGMYVADWKTELPDGEYVLVLRSNKDKKNHEAIVDIAGYDSDLKKSTVDFESSQWPLRGHGAAASDKNLFVEETVQRRQHTGILGTGTTHGDKK